MIFLFAASENSIFDIQVKRLHEYKRQQMNLLWAIHKYLDKRKKAGKNPRMTYFFDIEKCKRCLYKAGCYKEGAKRKTYTETLICDSHSEQDQFQEIEHFKEMAKERYKK